MYSITRKCQPDKTMSQPVHQGARIAVACKVEIDPDPEPEVSLQVRFERLRAAYNELARLCDHLQTPCPGCPCIGEMLKGH